MPSPNAPRHAKKASHEPPSHAKTKRGRAGGRSARAAQARQAEVSAAYAAFFAESVLSAQRLIAALPFDELEAEVEARHVVLGHVQRGGTPTARDRVLATRFGTRAADMVAEGLFGRMAALHGDKVTDVPLQEAVGTLKTVPPAYYDLATPFFG